MSDKSWDKDWLVFSRKSRRGVFVLLFVFIIVAVLPRVYRNYFMDDSLKFQVEELTENKVNNSEKFEEDSKGRHLAHKQEEQKPFSYNIPTEPFNPNTYSFEDWKAIGFSEKQVQTIVHYKQNGGEFRVKADVKKLYIVDEDLYAELYGVIDLPDTISSIENREVIEESNTTDKITVNINIATEEELKEVSGIGPFFAEQIIKLRNDYGGIHDLNQLLEIYRMDHEKLSVIKGSLIIVDSDIQKININTATRKELNNHKYISWNIANSIVSTREAHGEYKKTDDLLKSILIDQEKLETLKPYLTIE